MTTNLSRERVLHEIDHLAHAIGDLIERVEPERKNLPPDLQASLDELERSIILAKQFAHENTMDFRQVELGLMQLRALKADILSSLDGLRI